MMNIWLALSLILGVASVYMFTIEAFSVAFKLTGMATNKLKFQVASLFTSAGFTTTESELITNDERRRKIAVACMYTGHIYSVVIMGLVINVFMTLGFGTRVEPNPLAWYFIVFYISLGVFLLVSFIKIPPINKRFQRFLESIAINASKRSRNTNILTVLDMYGKHAIAEVILNNIPAYAQDKPLSKMGLTDNYIINILSIKRNKRIIEVSKDTMFAKGDTLIIFGLINDINEAFINSIDRRAQTIVVDRTNDLRLVNNYGENSLVEVFVEEVPKKLEGVKIKDAGLNDQYSITIGVIKRKGKYIFVDRNTIIEKGDLVTLFGPYKNIKYIFLNDEK